MALLKALKWVTVAAAVGNSITMLMALFARPSEVMAAEARMAIAGAVTAIEGAVGQDIPEELLMQLVEADLEIIRRYYAGPKPPAVDTLFPHADL